MNRRKIHEIYHSKIKLQKKIIDNKNFTYRTTISLVNKFFKTKDKILDIGSGAGTIDFYLAKQGHIITGVDISGLAVSMARLNVKLFNLQDKVKFMVSSFPSEKIRGKYDGVLISEVLEHLKDDVAAVLYIRKLMKKNSVLIASSPSLNAPLYRMGLLTTFDREVGHVRRYSQNGFKKLFTSNGFRVVKITKTEGIVRNFLFTNKFAGKFVRFIRGPISDFVTYADNLTISIFGESNYYIVAVKL